MYASLLVAACALVAHVPDAPQVPPNTAELVVIGWDAHTGGIIYTAAYGFADTWACEDAREVFTPDSDEKTRYMSQCISPTDVPL